MNAANLPEKKKKLPHSRRRRLVKIGLLILTIAAAVFFGVQWWQQRSFYEQALTITATLNKSYSPDGTRYLSVEVPNLSYAKAVWLVDMAAARAYTTNYADNFYSGLSWTADSRYAVLNGSTHYGASNLTIFDMDGGQPVSLNGYNPCQMFAMSVCNFETVIAIAPVSPLVLTADGTLFELPDVNVYHLMPERNTLVVEAHWSPSEQWLFWLSVERSETDATQAILFAYIGNSQGENPVQVHQQQLDAGADWFYSDSVQHATPEFCAWQSDERAVECEFDGQYLVLLDPEGA